MYTQHVVKTSTQTLSTMHFIVQIKTANYFTIYHNETCSLVKQVHNGRKAEQIL